MGEITISTEEYKELIEVSARVRAFADYVNNEDYSVGRKLCGALLGFEVKDIETD